MSEYWIKVCNNLHTAGVLFLTFSSIAMCILPFIRWTMEDDKDIIDNWENRYNSLLLKIKLNYLLFLISLLIVIFIPSIGN